MSISDSILYKDPKHWGNHYWFVMECVAYNYPDSPDSEDMEYATTFYTNLKYTLPCKSCAKHYRKVLEEYPIKDKICCRSCLQEWVKNAKKQIKLRSEKKEKKFVSRKIEKFNVVNSKNNKKYYKL